MLIYKTLPNLAMFLS